MGVVAYNSHLCADVELFVRECTAEALRHEFPALETSGEVAAL